MADFVRHADDTATIINTICKISDEIEIFEKFFELYPKLIEENLKKNEFLIKPEYDELSYTEQNIEDLLNVKVKERREKFEIASAHECVSSNCFVAGTLVTTADGKKPIEQIKIGDKVLSSMEDTNQVAFKQVTNTFVNETSELEHIHVNGETITATPEHPFYVDKLGWRLADNLRAGDVLVLSNGELVIVEWVQHEILEQPVKVYNFEVQDYHTYFVGENSVLVHNRCKCKRYVSLRLDDIKRRFPKKWDKMVLILKNLSEKDARKFFEIFDKQDKQKSGDFFENLDNSKEKFLEETINALIEYGNDLANVFVKYNDQDEKIDIIVKAVKDCTTPRIAIKALNKVPTKECAELINKYKEDGAKVITKGGKELVSKLNPKSDSGNSGNSGKLQVGQIEKFIRLTKNANQEFFNALTKYPDQICDGIKIVNKYGNNGMNIVGNFWGMKVYGSSEMLEETSSRKSAVITFAVAKQSNTTEESACYIAVSGIKNENLTIDGKITLQEGETYPQYYRNLLNDNRMEDLLSAIYNTYEKAKDTFEFDDITHTKNNFTAYNLKNRPDNYNNNNNNNNSIEHFSFEEKWQVANCAEVWSARKAILNHEKFDDLKYYSIEAEKGNYKEFCNNCKNTFKGHDYKNSFKDGFYE